MSKRAELLSTQTLGLVIGGLLPAVCFGLTTVFNKASVNSGISLGYYIIFVGLAVSIAGVALYCWEAESIINTKSATWAFLAGVVWAVGAAGITMALIRYHTPISKLVPIYNFNTLVAVSIGLLVFAEWRDMNTLKLLAGAILVVLGGSLVATA